MKFAVIGGDMRIARLCSLFASDGHDVCSFALEKGICSKDIYCADSPEEAAYGADCVVLPLPVMGPRGFLNSPLSAGEYEVKEILEAIEPGTLVCGGILSGEALALGEQLGLRMVDYFDREELKVFNAVATAEGAIGIIMQETPTTIWGSRILVIGYGRLGKMLSSRLRALGARVSVSARNPGDMAWITASGCTALDTRALEGHLSSFDVVVNTVPALVLTEQRLMELREDALCLDLASKPGGMDFAAASRLGVRAIWALSLPGEVAPETAGTIIRDTIYNILEEQKQ
jgi:dipicolinate synthase subunit A